MNPPVSLGLVVKDGVLKAQYTPVRAGERRELRRRVEEAVSLRGRPADRFSELTFGIPLHLGDITTDPRGDRGGHRRTCGSTPGCEHPTDTSSHTGGRIAAGLLTDIFWSSSSSEPRLRKGASSVRLATGDGRTDFYAGNVEFIGWVVGTK